MYTIFLFPTLLAFLCTNYASAIKLPGPLVYVVTPATQPLRIDEGRSAPFYYHNWMRRMDSPQNTTTSTTTTPRVETPDLIFAEFESGNGNNMKSIKNLLEKERLSRKTTSIPIHVPDDMRVQNVNYGSPAPVVKEKEQEEKQSASETADFYTNYNNLYNAPLAPVYLPSTAPSTTTTETITTTSSTTSAPNNAENIWHVIDSEKHNQYSGNWEELSIDSEDDHTSEDESKTTTNIEKENEKEENNNKIDENFALPGFSTNSEKGAENESRAIRTEANIRFPYVNLKPFQVKKPLLNVLSSSKKGNMFTNLDNFQDLKNPVRGEAQDVVHMRQPVDRYNPAQPYLPSPDYGKSRQSDKPTKAVSNLVPPPPPPPPKLTSNDFPIPTNYESFPPYAPAGPPPAPAPASAPVPPPSQVLKLPDTMFQPTSDLDNDSDSTSDDNSDTGPQMDLGYRYKPPSAQPFLPTVSPPNAPFGGYSYNKPPMTFDIPPTVDMDQKPDFQGYKYNKPEPPFPSKDHPMHSYGHGPPSFQQDSDYPELIFNKGHGSMDDTNVPNHDMKGIDMGMSPPAPPPSDAGPGMDSGPPMDDHGFPHDFPGDFKYHHDFDDHDVYHHHHEHTTTTTTETPRVNRFSYYYLGKKLYYLPLYFSVYFIVYVGALIIKAVLRHKIVYPNSWRPNDQTAGFFSKRSVDSWGLSDENLHEITGKVTHAIAKAGEKYLDKKIR